MKRIVLLLLALVVFAAGCSRVNRVQSTEGRKVELSPVWTFHSGGAPYNVYEFTDPERGQHCFVIIKMGDYRSGVALSCESLRE
jgi:hypothetical protein